MTPCDGRVCIETVTCRSRPLASWVSTGTSDTCVLTPVAPGSWDLLVNCTPVGMYPNVTPTPVPADALTGQVVYDLIYNPMETRLLREAVAAGCTAIGGLDMLVAQAQDQFQWWTGTRPEAAVMKAAALARLVEFRAHENHDA